MLIHLILSYCTENYLLFSPINNYPLKCFADTWLIFAITRQLSFYGLNATQGSLHIEDLLGSLQIQVKIEPNFTMQVAPLAELNLFLAWTY